jgi:DegV family protein with EDD domain
MTIRIVTDSTCDLPENVIQELEITLVPLYINIGDQGFLDGIEITRKEFYTNLPNYDLHPTTGVPGMDAFTQTSAIVDVAQSSANAFEQVPVTVRDSQQLSLGTGFQVETAARMAQQGKSLDEITKRLDYLSERTFVAAGIDTLEFLRRSGRMNAFMTGLGSLLQLKPILTMKNGLPGTERVRTTARAEARLIEMLQEHQPLERFALLHTNAPEKADEFRTKISHLLPEGDIYIMDITPVIGTHIGPGAVGFAIVSKSEGTR